MIITKEYIRSVRPEVPEKSDKYSWNLYLYLKRNCNKNIRAYKGKRGEIVVGHGCGDGALGMNIINILWDDKAQEYPIGIYHELKEITRYFEKYQRIGRYRDWETDRKSTRLNSSHSGESRMPSSA